MNATTDMLTIQRLPEGGYVVIEGYRPDNCQRFLVACSTIGEALDFIDRKLEPPKQS